MVLRHGCLMLDSYHLPDRFDAVLAKSLPFTGVQICHLKHKS
jgi:hypothetical protein